MYLLIKKTKPVLAGWLLPTMDEARRKAITDTLVFTKQECKETNNLIIIHFYLHE